VEGSAVFAEWPHLTEGGAEFFLKIRLRRGGLQIPPLRSCGAPVGMTRRRQLLSGRVAIWMDGIKSGHSPRRLQIPEGKSGVFCESEAEGVVGSPSWSTGQLKRSFILPSRLRDVGLLSMCMVSPSWRSRSRWGLVSFFGVFTTTCTTRSPRPCSFR
jgi:hypothetical protein